LGCSLFGEEDLTIIDIKKVVALSIILFAASLASSEELSVAAAADLNFAMRDIASQYQRDTGHTLKVSYGSSGNFFTQINNGAPFDLFFSADSDFPHQLESSGLAEPGSFYQYATGRLVLWVPNGTKLDLSRGMNVLLDPSIGKIAIANPRHAPYGRAAEAALRKAGLFDRIESKLVLGENISQTAQFVETGNADIGLIALALASSPALQSRGHYMEVPAGLYAPLQQGAIVLKGSSNKELAKQFLEYLKRPEIQTILHKYGFN
jgi:molybdate transport system substrate-binding protein